MSHTVSMECPADSWGSCPPPFPALCSGYFRGHFTHRAITFVLFYKFPVVVVVESGVGLHGLMLTQVLISVLDTVHGSTGDLRGAVGRVSGDIASRHVCQGQCWTEKTPSQPSFLRVNLFAGTLRLMESN